jgi:hypothetical protein
MTNDEKERILHVTTKLFSSILFISLIYYVIYLIGINLPYTIINYDNNPSYNCFENYFFLIIYTGEFYTRFQSIFLEPGHIGMICALLLYVNHYNLKNVNVIILIISIILSFSLAAYILTFLGYLIYDISKIKNIIKKTVKWCAIFIIFLVTLLFFYKNHSDSIFTNLIVNRLDYNEDKIIAGNNRIQLSFESYYEQIFFSEKNYFLGIGIDEFNKKFPHGGNSSYKVFIVQHGLLGVIILFIFFLIFVISSNSLRVLGLLILYCISFWQRPYALWEIELFLFICYSSINIIPKKNKLINIIYNNKNENKNSICISQ